MHPIAAQSLLAPRPSKAAPFFALSVLGHALVVIVALIANWLIAPKVIDLDQKPLKATLVRLGKPRDEKLLPRKEEPPPPPVEKPPEPAPVPVPVAAPPPAAVPIPGLDKKPAAKNTKEK